MEEKGKTRESKKSKVSRESRENEESRARGKSTESKERRGNEKSAGQESKDIVEKEFETYPDVAADIINSLLYEGRRGVAEQDLVPAPTESIYQGSERLRNQYQDIAEYKMKDGTAEMIYQFANQSDTDRNMILRKAGYTGGTYREQYEGKMPFCCPVAEMVLYWGERPWRSAKSIKQLFRKKELPPETWEYIDDLQLHVWEMRRLPLEVRQRFTSDMRIVVDFLAEGSSYRSDRPVKHKAALVRMIRVLSGELDVEDTEQILQDMKIGEEDEVTVCELFDQYERRGRQDGIRQGIRILIATCKEFNASFETTAAKIKEKYQLSDTEVQRNMKLYW